MRETQMDTSKRRHLQHDQEVASLLEEVKAFYTNRSLKKSSHPLTLQYCSKGSNESMTIRSKSYKEGCGKLYCGALNHVLEINPEKRTVLVEPRVTMEELVYAILPYGLTVPVIPELKTITVGGAIMGIGGESASHRYGTFNDMCTAFEFISGDGKLIRATPTENSDLFYGLPGSYGSLGPLVSAEITLVAAQPFVCLRYHTFSNPHEAIETLRHLAHEEASPDFLDGILFSKNLAVVIEGRYASNESALNHFPHYSPQPISAPFYFQHVRSIAEKNYGGAYEEMMSLSDYFFRYDLGSFWMGPYLFHPGFASRFVKQGLIGFSKTNHNGFNPSEIQKFHHVPYPNKLMRTLMRPFMEGKRLCQLLHKADKWVQDFTVIQDFCIPESNATKFLERVLDQPGIFPIWILPIKGTKAPQHFAPHLLTNDNDSHVINFGLYGVPSYSGAIAEITSELEKLTKELQGRKVLYSRSYYTEEEFWEIYPLEAYESLRNQTYAQGIWHNLTEKVLSR